MHTSPGTSSQKTVVIIGGGFAGINLAKNLERSKQFQIILVDKNNYNQFTPLVYQVATAFLEPSNISYPYRRYFRGKNTIEFRMGEFLRVDPLTHTCYLSTGPVFYDYLVFATGSITNYFGMEHIRQHAIPMKTINDALNMRNSLLQKLEEATVTTDAAERKKLLTIVVAGGGPTGVEVSGMLAELRKSLRAKDYAQLKNAGGEIYLVDASPALLMQMSKKSQQDAYDALSKLGVTIILNCAVKDYLDGHIILANGQHIETSNLIWAAGVTGQPIEGIPSTSFGKNKRLIADEYNRVRGVEDIFAIGDVCIQTSDPSFPGGHPQLAQPAIQQGKHLAKNFNNLAAGRPLQPFRYVDKGAMAIIGRNKAVVDLAKPAIHIHGFWGLFIWLFIHLASLLNYQNRLLTLINWIIAYLTRDQALRMIFNPREKKETQRRPTTN